MLLFDSFQKVLLKYPKSRGGKHNILKKKYSTFKMKILTVIETEQFIEKNASKIYN